MSSNRYRLAYLSRILPIISETFLVREIAALRSWEREQNFQPLPPGGPGQPSRSPGIGPGGGSPVPTDQPRVSGVASFLFFRYPGRYLHCLSRYGLLAPESWRNRRRCLWFFAVAPYGAWLLKRAGARHLHACFANAAASAAMLAAKLAGISFSCTVHRLASAGRERVLSEFNLHRSAARLLRGRLWGYPLTETNRPASYLSSGA